MVVKRSRDVSAAGNLYFNDPSHKQTLEHAPAWPLVALVMSASLSTRQPAGHQANKRCCLLLSPVNCCYSDESSPFIYWAILGCLVLNAHFHGYRFCNLCPRECFNVQPLVASGRKHIHKPRTPCTLPVCTLWSRSLESRGIWSAQSHRCYSTTPVQAKSPVKEPCVDDLAILF